MAAKTKPDGLVNLPKFEGVNVAGGAVPQFAREVYGRRLAERQLKVSPRYRVATDNLMARIVNGYDADALLTPDQFIAQALRK